MKKKYSYKEKKAFYLGVGAAIGCGRTSQIKRVTAKMTPEEKKSFYNGFDDYSIRKKF